ncbi:aromatic amino acid DMT transporter YddG [Sutterella sp.]|uniref:aromatic amino acid DMT transporter YddG n=1 Tax=Sutterella sp. TaxID=1981025 RepID=UPI0026E07043|nr:aromatic amino acid DMT transporter YddG [Sutterella sp.]MDO5532488.1 aromatic amino acid DMT transporter YddG [Sutterella sp.]
MTTPVSQVPSAASVRRATLIGLFAPVCWGMGVALVRGIAEGFGLAQGETLLYLVAVVCLWFMVGVPDLRTVDRRYLLLGLPMANLCSICYCLAIFFSTGGKQTMEVGMVNYLWPALTLLFAVIFNGVRTRWWIVPGVMLAFVGIIQILAGNDGFSLAGFVARLKENPWSYVMALFAALTWASFSSMTKAWSNGANLSTVIFAIDAAIYGVLWFLDIGTETLGEPDAHGIVSVVLGGAAMGAAYAAWTHGVSKGNVTTLALASYFTPVLACLFGVVWIGAELDGSFWTGVALVVAGSLLCWDATDRGVKALERAPKCCAEH